MWHFKRLLVRAGARLLDQRGEREKAKEKRKRRNKKRKEKEEERKGERGERLGEMVRPQYLPG